MSFEIHWGKLDEAVEEQVRALLAAHFAAAKRPPFLGEVHLDELRFGEVPPDVEVLDVTDPLPEFYRPPRGTPPTEDVRHPTVAGGGSPSAADARVPPGCRRVVVVERPAPCPTCGCQGHWRTEEALDAAGPGSPCPEPHAGEFPDRPERRPGARRRSSCAGGFAWRGPPCAHRECEPPGWRRASGPTADISPSCSPGSSARSPPSEPPTADTPGAFVSASDTDAQVLVRFAYDGNLRISLRTELKADYPGMPNFVVLPVHLTVTGARVDARAVIAHTEGRVSFCFLPHEGEHESIFRFVHIQSELGDESKAVLKNVDKVERFILDQLRKAVNENLVFPSFHSIPFAS